MPPKKLFRRLAVPSMLGSLMLCHGQLQAQQQQPQQRPQVRVAPNDQVLQSFQQSNMGGATPALAPNEDGSTRLDWHGGVTVDAYSNDIQSAGGAMNTPLRSGGYYRGAATSDLRAIHTDNSVDYFQVGITTSDDKAVLSQKPYQLNNLQIGRTGEGYSVAVGDIAPNFSSLSSALGARGVYGQRQFGEFTVHGFSGQVAENWEVLSSTVPSNQYLREVHGAKVEKTFGSNLRTYVTAQAFTEREAPLMAQPGYAPLGGSRSMSAGFQYQQDRFSLLGEMASSSFEDGGNADRQGHATILDAGWRGDSVGVRAGYHHLDTEFTSLSIAAQPGVHETYVGADWVAAPWLTLTTDLRKSKNSTLANAFSDSTFVDTDALTLRATINFGPEHPGWGLSLQQVSAQSVDSAEQVSRRGDFSATVNYASPELVSGLTIGQGKLSSEVSPFSDSTTESWSFNVGRNFSNAQPDAAPTWSAGVNFSATSQIQRLMATGDASKNTNYTLALTSQVVGWGSLNLLLTGGETTQPNGGPSLRVRGAQLEALMPMKGQSTFKLYARTTRRNIDDPVLSAQEDVMGMQLIYNF